MCRVCIIGDSADCPFCDNSRNEKSLGLLKCPTKWERLTAPAGSHIDTQGFAGEQCKNQLPMAKQGILTSLGDALSATVGGNVYSIDNAGNSFKAYRHQELPCLNHARFLEAMDRQIQEEASALSALADDSSDEEGNDDGKTYHPIIPVVVGRSGEQRSSEANSETHGRIRFLGTTKSGAVFDAAIQRPWQDGYAPHLPRIPSSPLLDAYYMGEASNFKLFRAIVPDYDPSKHPRPFKTFIPLDETPAPLMDHSLLMRIYNTWLPISRRPETAWRTHFDFSRISPIAETMTAYAYKHFRMATAWGKESDLIAHGNGDSSPSGSESEIELEDYRPSVTLWTADEILGDHSLGSAGSSFHVNDPQTEDSTSAYDGGYALDSELAKEEEDDRSGV